jgi:hypothetical protein
MTNISPWQNLKCVEIGLDMAIGKAEFFQVAGTGRNSCLGVKAKLAEQEIHAIISKVFEMSRGDRFGA